MSLTGLNASGEMPLPFLQTVVLGLLDAACAPECPFDPNGNWQHRYSTWLTPARPGRETVRVGSLTIRRAVQGDTVQLLVEQVSQFRGPGAEERLSVAIESRPDALSTPVCWNVESCVLDADGQPIEHTYATTAGQSDKAADRTCNWCLFDAVQRLPFEPQVFEFDLLEDLALLKRHHRLYHRESFEANVGKQPKLLHRFEQIGEGILPSNYWLDDAHRLVMAMGGVRAFVLEGESP